MPTEITCLRKRLITDLRLDMCEVSLRCGSCNVYEDNLPEKKTYHRLDSCEVSPRCEFCDDTVEKDLLQILQV